MQRRNVPEFRPCRPAPGCGLLSESGRLMERYALRHPRTAASLMRFCGIETDGSAEDYRLVGRDLIPFLAVRPREAG